MKIIVKKKDHTLEEFNKVKIEKAVLKSASRSLEKFTEKDAKMVASVVQAEIAKQYPQVYEKEVELSVDQVHNFVEKILEFTNSAVAKSYKDYRNYKKDFVHMLDEVYQKSLGIMYLGDKENSNTDSALVSTKRSLIFNELNKELYKRFFLTKEELKACKDGYIYVHDMSARNLTMNCCLFDVGNVMKNGFEMGNLWYNEPKTIDVAFDVIGDIVLSVAAQQYGGFTLPQIDDVLAYYGEKTYKVYYDETFELLQKVAPNRVVNEYTARNEASRKLERDIKQGYKGLEYKFNSVGSSRGDYPFVTITFGLNKTSIGKLINKTILKVHQEGQGKKGAKRPTLFPKLVFLYDKELHSKDCELYDVYLAAIECSSKAMYPDFLSLTNEDTTIGKMYTKYGEVISPMGCRAFLSPYYENGGRLPKDENDKPVFVGRWNAGAISLNLPMILAKANEENRDFYEVLDEYLIIIRNLHKRTKEYLGNLRASVNPMAFCEGGFYKGNLQPHDKIKKAMGSETYSFGITALNELQELYNQKSLVEDNDFSIKVMEYINKRKSDFTEEDNMLYAIYGTPAESLCGLQIQQFRNKYGVIKNVSDREYVSNSFHCHVVEDISPIQKQDYENEFWHLFEGGRIQYCKYPIRYNKAAIDTLVTRAMNKGFYEGINMDLNYCDHCGYENFDDEETCPKCGSSEIVSINRMNGYLSYSRVKGDSRLNDAKMAEIKERKSM